MLLSFGLFPGGRLAIYSIALSVPYLNGSFPAKRTLDLFVSKRIVFLWAYCSSSLRCGLLQIDSRNKRKALLVWVLFLYTFYSICWLLLTFRIYNYNWRGKSVLTQSSLRSDGFVWRTHQWAANYLGLTVLTKDGFEVVPIETLSIICFSLKYGCDWKYAVITVPIVTH